MAGQKFIFNTLTTDARSTDIEGVGTVRYEGEQIYRWVKFPTTNYTPAQGDVVCHQFTDGATALEAAYKPATATLGFMAGIVCSPNVGASTGTNPLIYSWIQVGGPTNLATVTTAAASAGASLIAVNAATYMTLGTSMGTAPIYTRRCLMLDTTGAATVANVLVQCFP